MAHRLVSGRYAALSCALLLAGAPAAPREPAAALPNANRTAAGRLADGVLTIALVAARTTWHPNGPSLPGLNVAAFAEQGKAALVPGPLIRVPSGTEIRATVRNALDRDTITLHMPAIAAGAAAESLLIAPGDSREVRVRAERPGNYIYRATTKDPLSRALRVHQLLSGALVVDATAKPNPDRVFVLTTLADTLDADNLPLPGRAVFAVNGLSWPHTERISAIVGDTLRWRVINASIDTHPMHLHGVYFRVDDFSGPQAAAQRQLAVPRWVVTERLTVMAAMSLTWVPERPGGWLFHCHFQEHVTPEHLSEGAHANHAVRGMLGLVLGITARPRSGAAVTDAPAARRRLRLVAVRDSGYPPSAPSMRFVLHDPQSGERREVGPAFSPPVYLRRGEPVRISVVNQLTEATAVHWHGMELESYYDGVAGFSGIGNRLTPLIAPGDSFEARFTPPRAGTFIYHSHVNETRQHRAGLVGALIVQDEPPADAATDMIFFLKSSREPPPAPPRFDINGQVNPDTTILQARKRYRLRFIHMGVTAPGASLTITGRVDSLILAPRDTLLQEWRPIAKDGSDLPDNERVVRSARLIIGMGETYDFEFVPAAPGRLHIEVRMPGRGGRLLARVPIRVE